MSKKNKSRLAGELSYLFLAPFLVLVGILTYGILFDKWHKDPKMILEYSILTYGVLSTLRLLIWAYRTLSR